MKPVQSLTLYSFEKYFNIILPPASKSPVVYYLQAHRLQFCTDLSSLTCVLHAPDLILFDTIVLIRFGEGYKFFSSSIYSLLHPPDTFSL